MNFQELIGIQQVYASTQPVKQNSIIPVVDSKDYKEQYRDLFENIDITTQKAMCKWNTVVSQGAEVTKIVECSSLSADVLSQKFCTNNKVWQDVSWLQWEEAILSPKVSGKRWCACPNWYVEDDAGKLTNECLKNTAGDLGISCDPSKLINGTCTWNINKTLGIRWSDTSSNPTVLLQDVVLSATSFVGTLIMIALVVMGFKYVQGWYDEGTTGDLKGNIRKLLIWLVLVIWSYTFVRIIQYVARGY